MTSLNLRTGDNCQTTTWLFFTTSTNRIRKFAYFSFEYCLATFPNARRKSFAIRKMSALWTNPSVGGISWSHKNDEYQTVCSSPWYIYFQEIFTATSRTWFVLRRFYGGWARIWRLPISYSSATTLIVASMAWRLVTSTPQFHFSHVPPYFRCTVLNFGPTVLNFRISRFLCTVLNFGFTILVFCSMI